MCFCQRSGFQSGVPGAAASTSPENLLETKFSGPTLDLPSQQTRGEARHLRFNKPSPVAQVRAHVGSSVAHASRCHLRLCVLPGAKRLGRNSGIPGLATHRCPSARAQGALTSAPCGPTASKGGAGPPRLHTSSCTGDWAGPGNKSIGATPLKKKSPPAWVPSSPVAGSPRSRQHG